MTDKQIIAELPIAIRRKINAKFYPAAKLKNLIVTMGKYIAGETPRWAETKLREEGWIATDPSILEVVSENDICETQQALAIRMDRHYRNPDGSNRLGELVVTNKVISLWHQMKTPESALNPPPGKVKGIGNRYSLKAWIEWVDKYVLPAKCSSAQPNGVAANHQDDLLVMEQQDKRDAILHQRWEREQKKGEFVHRSVAQATGIAAVRKIHLMVKQEDERNLPKLRLEKLLEIGVPSELAARFAAWDKEQMRLVTDRRETAMELAGMDVQAEVVK